MKAKLLMTVLGAASLMTKHEIADMDADMDAVILREGELSRIRFEGIREDKERLLRVIAKREGAAARELFRQTHGKVGRNDPCVCGTGKKFKKCCMA